MDSIFFRGFVIALTLTGVGASAVRTSPATPASINAPDASTKVKAMDDGGGDSGPIPMCMPHDPTHCGMD